MQGADEVNGRRLPPFTHPVALIALCVSVMEQSFTAPSLLHLRGRTLPSAGAWRWWWWWDPSPSPAKHYRSEFGFISSLKITCRVTLFQISLKGCFAISYVSTSLKTDQSFGGFTERVRAYVSFSMEGL